MNKVILMGNLGNVPEVRQTQSGESVANFSLATNKKWKDKSGQLQEHTEWHRVVVWGPAALSAGKYLIKGSKVLLEGELKTNKWKDKEGVERYTTEVNSKTVQYLSSRPKDADATPAGVVQPGDENDVPW